MVSNPPCPLTVGRSRHFHPPVRDENGGYPTSIVVDHWATALTGDTFVVVEGDEYEAFVSGYRPLP